MKTFRRTLLRLFILTAFITGLGVVSTLEAQDKVTNSDSAFINKNIADNITEIAMARMAEQKAADPGIKKAAAQILEDHSQILNDLRRIGIKKDVIDASEKIANPASKTAVHPAVQGLENATGKEFEKLWISHMLGTHEAKIAELEMTSEQITDVELRSVVNRSLQKIKIHRDVLTRLKYKYQQ